MKNDSPKVTALVPSYNHGRYIRERIKSVLDQTYGNVELIVIDDYSEDDSHPIISELQSRYGFKYLRNSRNSGSPFAAWEQVCKLADGDYIWICESDDVAEPQFLETAVAGLLSHPNAVMFYCSSHIINDKGEQVGHTDNYFHEIWKETRWDQDFTANGIEELRIFQSRGQTVPNMSSALFTAEAFRSSFTPFLKRLRLTGDWLFIGDVMKRGDVIFDRRALSRFREHQVTSRVRVKSARSQAEFILTKYLLFKDSGRPISEFVELMKTDVIRFLYEPARWHEVARSLFQVSGVGTVRFSVLLFASIVWNPVYIKKFIQRFTHAKHWRISNQPN